MIEIKKVTTNKKQYLPLLLLADEQEDMIDVHTGRQWSQRGLCCHR